jgi:hypothetical protein
MAQIPGLSIIVLSGIALIGGSACHHTEKARAKAPVPAPPPSVIVESDRPTDNEVTLVEVIPPQGEAEVAAAERPDAPPPLEGATHDRVAEPPTAREAAPVARAPAAGAPIGQPAIGLAALEPQKGSMIQGSATAMDTASGTAIAVSVRLAVAGRYEVYLLAPMRACDERKDGSTSLARRPKIGKRDAKALGLSPSNGEVAPEPGTNLSLGVLVVGEMGTGELQALIPAGKLPWGVRTLDKRAIVVFDESDRPLASRIPLSCGEIRFIPPDEPVG